MFLPDIPEHDSDSETLHNADASSADVEASGSDKKNSSDELPGQSEKKDSQINDNDDTALGTVESLGTDAKKKLHFEQVKATGPKGFNPTNARFHIRWKSDEDGSDSNAEPSDRPKTEQGDEDQIALRWSSRYNRKGRNSFVVSRRPSADQRHASYRACMVLSNFKRVGKNIIRMLFSFPYWDMAFWSGWSYSWGSVLFIICAAFAWAPIAYPETEFHGESYASGMLFFVGALLYEVGASVAYLEAINDGSFHGSAMKRFLEGHEDDQKRLLDEKLGAFFGHLVPHSSKNKKVKGKRVGRLANATDVEAGWFPDRDLEKTQANAGPRQRRGGVDYGSAQEEGQSAEYLPWRWWPTWDNFKNHYIREIGYWACAIQLLGATLYGVCGVVAVPPIIDSLSHWQLNVAYYIPQIVASCCFLSASFLFMIETQEKWYKPEPTVLGWWVGFCAIVGSCGFLLCACLGPAYGSHGAQYQSNLASLWGSGAYMMSGLLQWYEAVNKNPIEELFNEPGKLKSFQVHL